MGASFGHLYLVLYEKRGLRTLPADRVFACALIRAQLIPYASPSSRAAVAVRKHTAIPIPVGRRKARTVHFQLPLSLWMVMQVVEQGQCTREKSMVHTAVSQVQPWAVRTYRKAFRSDSSRRLPAER